MGDLATCRERGRHRLQFVDHLDHRPPFLGMVEEVEYSIEVVGSEDDIDPGRSGTDQLTVLLSGTPTNHEEDAGALLLEGLEVAEMTVEPVVGVLSDGAGVDEHHVGLIRLLGRGHPVCGEHPRHPLAVVLVHLAAEGADEVAAADALWHPTLSARRW